MTRIIIVIAMAVTATGCTVDTSTPHRGPGLPDPAIRCPDDLAQVVCWETDAGEPLDLDGGLCVFGYLQHGGGAIVCAPRPDLDAGARAD